MASGRFQLMLRIFAPGGRTAALLLLCLTAIALSGCATVRWRDEPEAPVLTEDQKQLRDVAEGITETPWRKPDEASMFGRVTSVLMTGRSEAADADDRFTADDAAALYVRQKIDETEGAEQVFGAILEDAANTLNNVDRLLTVAEALLADPDLSEHVNQDIATLEQAIVSVRSQRTMYDRIFDKAAVEGVAVPEDAAGELLALYREAERDIGAAADALVDEARASDEPKRRGLGNWLRFSN